MLPVALSASMLPPSVPTNMTPLLACAGVEYVKLSAAVNDQPRNPHVEL